MSKKKIVQTAVPIHVPSEEWARVAEAQRQHLRALADKIERGEPIEPSERLDAAMAIRIAAERIPDAPKRRPGRPKAFPGGDAALLAVFYRCTGRSEEDAVAEAAATHGVPYDTMLSAYKAHKVAAENALAAFGLRPRKKSRQLSP